MKLSKKCVITIDFAKGFNMENYTGALNHFYIVDMLNVSGLKELIKILHEEVNRLELKILDLETEISVLKASQFVG